MDSYLNINVESDIVKKGNKLFYALSDINVLCEYDINIKKAHVISRIGNESILLHRAYRRILEWKDKLIFIPYCAKNIALYDLPTKQWEMFSIEYSDIMYKFAVAEIFNNSLYLFGHNYPDIIKIDLLSKKIKYYNYFTQGESRHSFFGTTAVKVQDTLYVPLCETNEMVSFNLITEEIRSSSINGGLSGYCGVGYDGNYLWLGGRRGRIVNKLDRNQVCSQINLDSDNIYTEQQYYSYVISNDSKVYFLSQLEQLMDVVSGGNTNTIKLPQKVISIGSDKDGTFYMVSLDGILTYYDNLNSAVTEYSIAVSEREIVDIIQKEFIDENDIEHIKLIDESAVFGLKRYIEILNRV